MTVALPRLRPTAGLVPIAALLLVTIVAPPVLAQSRPQPSPARTGRIFVAVNAATHLDSRDVDDTYSVDSNGEQARFETAYTIPAGPALDIAGGAMLTSRVGVGVGITRLSTEATATVEASLPHPFFFNQPRAIEGEATGLSRSELGVHVQARFLLPVTPRWQVMLYGGPTFFRLTQALVTSTRVRETYPYDDAQFDGAVTTEVEESKVGVNVGADVAYFFTSQVGIGGMLQYAGATVAMPAQGRSVDVKVGGVQAGGGIRLRF